MRVTKNKIAVAKSIDHRRRVGQRQEPGGCIALNIEVLMPRVERRREQTTLLPFEGLLFCPVVPNRGRAAAFDNIDQLFKQIALGFALASGRDLADIRAAGAARADQIDERTEDARARPRRHWNGAQVFYTVTAHDRNLLQLLPKIIGSLVRIRRCSCQLRRDCSVQRSFWKNPTRSNSSIKL